ncbi:hypothetical protein GF358_03500 [Candidatus Woesearchaeota archaeon]|nr:hypothetical protein [Candidatus Woesearchaeota archaeon]
MFKIHKQQTITLKIYDSGLIDHIENKLHPRCIILFGSVRKGEYTKKSDIDLFVQAQTKQINLEKYEKKLKHKINLFFEKDFHKLSKELLENLINGIKLSGYIRI